MRPRSRLSIRERTALLRARSAVDLVLIPVRRAVFTTDYTRHHQPRVVTLPAMRFLEERP